MTDREENRITSVLQEDRAFPPSESFRSVAHIKSMEDYDSLWKYSVDQPEKFWSEQARDLLEWHQPFSKTLDWNLPHVKWFEDGTLNASVNCLDRHIKGGKKDDPAIIWEGEPGDTRTLTYGELLDEVCRCANVLKELNVKKGDRVTIYMPMIPELVITVLACARIGATHCVVFGGFSSDALADRNNDAQAKLIVTADGGFRKGSIVSLKENVDRCLPRSTSVEKVLVVKRVGTQPKMCPNRDYWWHELMAKASTQFEAVPLPAEHPLFILYTSGSTGKPKGILHTTGGYLLGATLSAKLVFDLKEGDIYWCTADVGWITGHSYVIYGPLSNGSTALIYEGAPNYPNQSRFWQMIERHRVSIFYTAPTAIRSFMKWGDEPIKGYDLSSLRLLGTVGEPINPEAWMWYHEKIGKKRCPIVDTWWQTETGSIMITPLPGATTTIPGTATRPFLGVNPDVVDREGRPVGTNEGGFLVIKQPWPSMLRGIYGDTDRFHSVYWKQLKNVYFTGDGARKDEHGNFWILGRIDDVLNVSGHRLSTMEIESALVSHPLVVEAAVVGQPHEIKGEGIYGFVCLRGDTKGTETIALQLKEHVAKQIGAIAKPDTFQFTDSLPKTRSGKIMRRLLRDIASGRKSFGDMTTLEDGHSLNRLREQSSVVG